MNEEKKSYKVNDRRRFDGDGNERLDADSKAPAKPLPAEMAAAVKAQSELQRDPPSSNAHAPQDDHDSEQFIMNDPKKNEDQGAEGTPDEHTLSFSSFIMSLATQALMQMGEIEPPGAGMKLPPDFEAAKQSIEVIGMLAAKTKGNLDPEEQRLMVEVLHTLRMKFVQRLNASASGS